MLRKEIEHRPVDGEVETHEVNEGLILAETEEVRQVVGVILGGIDSREFTLAVKVVVNPASDAGKLGNTVGLWSIYAGHETL